MLNGCVIKLYVKLRGTMKSDHILFNSLFQMTNQKKLKEIFQVNFFSQIHLTQLISREMQKNKKGSIIFISSTSAEGRDYGRFAYSSSKAAISSVTRVLAKEFGSYNIRVNSVNPGLTNTDMMRLNIKKDALDFELKKTSLGRIAETYEIANLVAFLASDLSTYITGQNIRIDGGL
jgi:3-oxoacyl-[acyl-carrier protein] reductase